MKLSIVIICWNDRKVIKDCLASIFKETSAIEFEVIVSDNGSTDGSVEYIREHFPSAVIIDNKANLGFAKGNNVGIWIARGEYVLILNPDTIIHDRALEKLVAFADRHSDAGAFGCRVLNPDGSLQNPAAPLPTVSGYLIGALSLRFLARLSDVFQSDVYYRWDGLDERRVGWQCGCCVMFRRDLLKTLGGFDEQFFYHFEETDLCCRVWKSGAAIWYLPDAEITHLGGQSVGRFPIRFAIETYRSRFRYFHKHFGTAGLIRIRRISLLGLWLRWAGYGIAGLARPSESLRNRIEMYRVLIAWIQRLDVVDFIETGTEPDVGYSPLAPAP